MSKRARAKRVGPLMRELEVVVGFTGEEQYAKVQFENALYRVTGALASFTDDVILTLEDKPCWQRKQGVVPSEDLLPVRQRWYNLKIIASRTSGPTFEREFVLVTDKFSVTVAKFDSDSGLWFNYLRQQLDMIPTHWAPIGELPE